MIRGYIISLINHHQSTIATRSLIESIKTTKSEIEPIVFPATVPGTIESDLKKIDHIDTTGLAWTYPTKASQDGVDLKSGMTLHHYKTENLSNRVACMVSHMRCWQETISRDEPIVVFEHDAKLIRQFKEKDVLTNEFKGGIIGLNNPIGATRKSRVFHEKISTKDGLSQVPSVDGPSDPNLPQGLAGNSAYLITPTAAKKLLDKVREVGMWPNDAVMCKQFFPWLQVVYPYYTEIQKGLKSTTTR
jgi:GR25 family glycosyltransferase involved in LPS biosynthesis